MSDGAADHETLARIRERLATLETEQKACSDTQDEYGKRLTFLERSYWLIIGGSTVVAAIGALLIDYARKHYGL